MQSISDIQLNDQTNTPRSLKDFGPKVLLFVYPKDNTPGCTIENRDFSHLREEFLRLGVEPVGISADSAESHTSFCSSQGLNTTLLSDPDKTLIAQLDAYGEKKMYGKIIGKGIIRSTFLIDTSAGAILQEWRNVRAVGHAAKILKELSK
jgi:thioredoxin-dependent peroxiredoxin